MVYNGVTEQNIILHAVFLGAFVATSPLQQRANEVRANRVNWQSYLQ